jgi:DNA-binding transcriptional LysR family regulator
LQEIEAELTALGNLRGRPVGTVRITATEHAVRSIIWPRLLPWLPKYPEIKIEISSDNRFVDIVAERFDIGIRLGGDVAKNMIAFRTAPDMRMVVVGSPAYFERNPPPQNTIGFERTRLHWITSTDSRQVCCLGNSSMVK